jgi:hypothetical protein
MKTYHMEAGESGKLHALILKVGNVFFDDGLSALVGRLEAFEVDSGSDEIGAPSSLNSWTTSGTPYAGIAAALGGLKNDWSTLVSKTAEAAKKSGPVEVTDEFINTMKRHNLTIRDRLKDALFDKVDKPLRPEEEPLAEKAIAACEAIEETLKIRVLGPDNIWEANRVAHGR